jgi:hypothetical protein
MWYELSYNVYMPRSARERLRYENDEQIIYDEYTQRLIDDQDIYDTENQDIDCALQHIYVF